MFLSLVNLFMLTDSALSSSLFHTSCSDFCLAGYYALEECPKKTNLNRSYKCEKCPQNTFTAINNTVQKCHRCNTCQENQVEKQSCDYNRDRQCVCQEGYYQENTNSQCKRCVNDCKGNSHCVASCSSFPTTTTTTTTTTFQAPKAISSFTTKPNPVIVKEDSSFSMISFLVILMTLIVTFGLICTRFCLTTSRNVCLRRKKNIELSSKELQPNGNHQITSMSVFQADQTSCPVRTSTTLSREEHLIHVTPLLPHPQLGIDRQEPQPDRIPATVLYAIIKEVPLRRWKEFLRLLAVPERQLERMELEANMVTGFLERQYLMLRLWSQQPAATLEDVYSALQYMELAGCAQQLQSSLDNIQGCTGAGRLVTQPVTSPQLPRTTETWAVNTKL